MQNAEEDMASYVATLRGLALSCRFEQLSDSPIRDQLVRCAYTKKIRKKLLLKDPNLDEAIQIAKRMEHTALWLQEMDNSTKEGKQNVISEIKNKSKFLISEEKKKSTRNWEYPNLGKFDSREVKCYRCGAPGHTASSKMCAARSAICRNCGKRGHFAKVCKFKNN
ncbi:CCHC-type zinc finger nucleic acid binding protein-like [Pleurodeles waltl]|uniref:CCHC-type zinc finger nucleic acid binding protein-like n=1 Tax=Pleurodeles waltl TaxID=8319 RepID=UPI00370948EC